MREVQSEIRRRSKQCRPGPGKNSAAVPPASGEREIACHGDEDVRRRAGENRRIDPGVDGGAWRGRVAVRRLSKQPDFASSSIQSRWTGSSSRAGDRRRERAAGRRRRRSQSKLGLHAAGGTWPPGNSTAAHCPPVTAAASIAGLVPRRLPASLPGFEFRKRLSGPRATRNCRRPRRPWQRSNRYRATEPAGTTVTADAGPRGGRASCQRGIAVCGSAARRHPLAAATAPADRGARPVRLAPPAGAAVPLFAPPRRRRPVDRRTR